MQEISNIIHLSMTKAKELIERLLAFEEEDSREGIVGSKKKRGKATEFSFYTRDGHTNNGVSNADLVKKARDLIATGETKSYPRKDHEIHVVKHEKGDFEITINHASEHEVPTLSRKANTRITTRDKQHLHNIGLK